MPSELGRSKLLSLRSSVSRGHCRGEVTTQCRRGPRILRRSEPGVVRGVGAGDPAGRVVRPAWHRRRTATPADGQGIQRIRQGGHALPTWRAATRQGWLWSPLAHGPTPQSWQDAADLRVAAGLVVEGARRRCTLVPWDFKSYTLVGWLARFITPRGSRPLLTICETPVHTDWCAWASMLSVGHPSATPPVSRGTAVDGWHCMARQRAQPSADHL
jgi:hypothetical protein